MSAKICWLCDTNFAVSNLEVEDRFLDEEGNKPCLECLQEMMEKEQEDA